MSFKPSDNSKAILPTAPWAARLNSGPEAARLVCFPYAGGSAHVFFPWKGLLPDALGLYAVQLPGRGKRMKEPPATDLLFMADRIAADLEPFLDLRIAFFGHSMGALLAFEVARALRSRGHPIPQLLIVSGHQAPSFPRPDTEFRGLSDEEFLDRIRNMQGTPPGLLDDPQMRSLIAPVLRADFAAVETYRYVQEPPLDCPIQAFGGLSDEYFPKMRIEAWASETTHRFSAHMLEGGHFFINQSREELFRLMIPEIRDRLGMVP